MHVQNAHSDTKGYACSMCDAKFKWPRSLERHCLAVHEGFKFKCTECDTLLGRFMSCQFLDQFMSCGFVHFFESRLTCYNLLFHSRHCNSYFKSSAWMHTRNTEQGFTQPLHSPTKKPPS